MSHPLDPSGAPTWTGKATVQSGWAVFQGTAGDHARHRHHAVQIAIGIHGPLELWAENPGALIVPGAVIAAGCEHQLASGPDPVLLLYLERESEPGRALDDWCGKKAKPLSQDQNRRLQSLIANAADIGPQTIEQVLNVILGSASTIAHAAFRDERISRSIDSLPRRPPERVSVATLAKQAGLSPSRYAHLFRAHTGMPLRPYLRWLRLQQALAEVAHGANLTDAAYAAGFTDSAHLSRTFRRTFGIRPNILLHPALSLKAGTG